MKKWMGMGSGFILSMLAGFHFLETQKDYFSKIKEDHKDFQRQLRELEKDIGFANRHKKDLAFLVEKGWFVPQSRLIAGEMIEQLSSPLTHIQYTFEPEKTHKRGPDQTYKVTPLTIVMSALLDTDIYDFFQALLEKFPGVLCPRELMLFRLNTDVTQKEPPSFVEGTLVLDWISSGEDYDK